MWTNKNLVHQVGDQTKVILRCTVNHPSKSHTYYISHTECPRHKKCWIKKPKKLNRNKKKIGMYRHSIPLWYASSVSHNANTSSHCSVFLCNTPPSPTHAKEKVSSKRTVSWIILPHTVQYHIPSVTSVWTCLTINKPLLLPSGSRQCLQKIQRTQRLPDTATSATHMSSPLPANQNTRLWRTHRGQTWKDPEIHKKG